LIHGKQKPSLPNSPLPSSSLKSWPQRRRRRRRSSLLLRAFRATTKPTHNQWIFFSFIFRILWCSQKWHNQENKTKNKVKFGKTIIQGRGFSFFGWCIFVLWPKKLLKK
jgi:hypothetical protein